MNWPTREEAMRLTALVIGISIGLALFLGLFDFIFAGVVRNIVLSGALERTAPEEESPSGPENTQVPAGETAEPAEDGESNR